MSITYVQPFSTDCHYVAHLFMGVRVVSGHMSADQAARKVEALSYARDVTRAMVLPVVGERCYCHRSI